MKEKVQFFDRKLINNTIKIGGVFLTIILTILPFLELKLKVNIIVIIVSIFLVIIAHVFFYFKFNKLNKITLRVNNSNMNIFFGDLFDTNEIKVISFNEYFDTVVDDKIISETSINGQFIKKIGKELLDTSIDNDQRLKDSLIEVNEMRNSGKKNKYKLGTIHVYKNNFLLAFSKFDDNNRATLSLKEYVSCLMNMWEQIDINYNGKTVVIPLLGSGITRFKDGIISEQELLEIIIWSFKISKVKFHYPSRIEIVIKPNIKDKINLFSLK